MGLSVHNWVSPRSSVLGDEERQAPVYELQMTFGLVEAPDPTKWRTILAVGVAVVSPRGSGRDWSRHAGNNSLNRLL
jgi:hypothetical protein